MEFRSFKIMGGLFLMALLCVVLSGCTSFQTYERTIVRIYDADMNLKEIREIEHISQPDPVERPMHPELKKQTYQLPQK